MEKSPKELIGPVNLGNPKEFTLLELAKAVGQTIGKRQKIEFLPLPRDDPKQRRPDISIAKEKLDWEPKASLEDGLSKTMEYFRALKSA